MLDQPHCEHASVLASRPLQKVEWLQCAAGVFCLVILVTIAHGPAIPGDFVWDDHIMIRESEILKAPDGLARIWFTTELTDYWPVAYSTHWIEWRFFGANASGYRVVNMILHACNAILVWIVLRQLQIPGAFVVAAIFAVHPITVEAVAWLLQRKTLLSTFFVLLAVSSYLQFDHHRRWWWYVAAVGLFLLALLSKTSAVMLPPALLLCLFWRRRRFALRDFCLSLPFFLMSLAIGLVGLWFQRYRAMADDSIRNDSFLSRLAGAGDVVWFYLGKALLPLHLSFVYPKWEIRTDQVATYVPLSLLLFVLAVAFVFRRSWSAPLLVGFGNYVLWLFPVMGFANIYFMRYSRVADHWQYTALPCILALFVGVVAAATQSRPIAVRITAGLLAVLVVASFTRLSVAQSLLYRDQESIWRDSLATNPDGWLAHNMLGSMASRDPERLDEAIGWFQRAAEIDPVLADNWYNLGNCYRKKGDLEQAERSFERALELSPQMAAAHNNLGLVMLAKRDLSAAESHLREAVRLSGRVDAREKLGALLLHRGDLTGALEQFNVALSQGGRSPSLFYLSGITCLQLGQTEEAMARLQNALALNANFVEAARELAWLLACHPADKIRNGELARQLAERACTLTNHRDPRSLEALAAALAELRQFGKAAETNEQATEAAIQSGAKGVPLEAMKARTRLYRAGQPNRI